MGPAGGIPAGERARSPDIGAGGHGGRCPQVRARQLHYSARERRARHSGREFAAAGRGKPVQPVEGGRRETAAAHDQGRTRAGDDRAPGVDLRPRRYRELRAPGTDDRAGPHGRRGGRRQSPAADLCPGCGRRRLAGRHGRTGEWPGLPARQRRAGDTARLPHAARRRVGCRRARHAHSLPGSPDDGGGRRVALASVRQT